MLLRPLVQFIMLCALSCGLGMGAAWAQSEANSQTVDRIKAAYIYNFAKFVEMPLSEDKTLRLCVVGRDDLNGALQALQRRTAQGREVVVRRDVPLDQIKDCAMAFVGESDGRMVAATAKQLGGSPILLVSDARQAIEHGAHLALIFNEDRVEFDVNLLQLQKSGIKASSQMIKLARTVLR